MFDKIDDPRVSYNHNPQPMTIGAKRNALVDMAKGDIIAHFDDDDFYAPHYIERMLSLMADLNVAFVKLFGFYLYDKNKKVFAYWDLERDFPFHLCLHPGQAPFYTRYRSGVSLRWGYGFSYVFDRHIFEEVKFPDQDHGEDQKFADNALSRFKSAGKQPARHPFDEHLPSHIRSSSCPLSCSRNYSPGSNLEP